jgi:hypothetical protein
MENMTLRSGSKGPASGMPPIASIVVVVGRVVVVVARDGVVEVATTALVVDVAANWTSDPPVQEMRTCEAMTRSARPLTDFGHDPAVGR